MVFQLGNGYKVGIMMGAVIGDAPIISTDSRQPDESLLVKKQTEARLEFLR